MPNVVNKPNFQSAGDWINRILDERCTNTINAVPAETDDEGNVVKRGRKGKKVLDLEALKALAADNAIEVKAYPNPGMYRMNVGNMLRAAARKRGGLVIDGEFTSAPSDFEVNEKITENPDGSKITAKVEEAA
jgi:hypothetical protein